jgi:hypothetical protein
MAFADLAMERLPGPAASSVVRTAYAGFSREGSSQGQALVAETRHDGHSYCGLSLLWRK